MLLLSQSNHNLIVYLYNIDYNTDCLLFHFII